MGRLAEEGVDDLAQLLLLRQPSPLPAP